MNDDDNKAVLKVDRDIVSKQMVITANDADVVIKFFEHFKLDMPKKLKQTLTAFTKDPNIKTQKEFVIEVNKAISGENSIDSLDEMFKPIVECAKVTAYELEFNEEISNMLESNPQIPQVSESEEP